MVDATNYCGTAETQVEVAQPSELKITEVNKQNNICYGEENGEFEIFISGDKSIYNHEIKWFYYDNEKYVEINNQNKIDISNDRLTASSMPNGKYKIEVESESKALIEMTLTSPNCPVAESLPKEVKDSIMELKEVNKVDLDLVWEPPWDKSMMSEAAKLELNL